MRLPITKEESLSSFCFHLLIGRPTIGVWKFHVMVDLLMVEREVETVWVTEKDNGYTVVFKSGTVVVELTCGRN